MATIKRFEDIESRKLASQLTERMGQLIDEGFERGSRKEFILFPGYAKGSAGEFRSQLYRALNRNYITKKPFDTLYEMSVNISGKLQKLIEYLLKTNIAGTRKNIKP